MRNSNSSIKDIKDTWDEYDYMGSLESIPAKINLARMLHIAMEDCEMA